LEGANFANNVPQFIASTEENTMNFQQDNPSANQDLNPELKQYETTMLSTTPSQ